MKKNNLPLLIIFLPIAFVVFFLWFLYGRDDIVGRLSYLNVYTREELRFLQKQGFLDDLDSKNLPKDKEQVASAIKSKELVEQNLDDKDESFQVLASKIDLKNNKYQMAFKLENKSSQSKDFYLIPVSSQNQTEFSQIKGKINQNREIVLNNSNVEQKPLSELYNVQEHKSQLRPELAQAYSDIELKNYQAKPIKITLDPKSFLLASSEWNISRGPTSGSLEPVYVLVQGSAGGAMDSLTILTVHSHPQQGENWEVEFETRGQSDLKIIPTDQATIDDDEFTGLYCNDEKRDPQILAGDVIYYPDWQCSGTGKVIHYTKKAGNHTLRFEFGDQISYAFNNPDAERQSPDAYVTQTNLDGVIGDIDEDPDTPDGNWADAVSDSSDVLAHVSFPSPSGNLTTGSGLQNFKIYARRSTSAATPTIYADLYENGAYKAQTSLTSTNVTSDSGQLFTGTWDASSLSNIDGSGVEAYVYGTKAGGPSFTYRTPQYARGSSLTSPYNFTVNIPSGTVDGDIMFMYLSIYIATPPTIDSVPEGWTQIATNTAGNSRWYLYYKVASSEGASYTWSLTASCRYYAVNISYASGAFDVQSISDITAISNTLYGTSDATVRAASMNVPNANSPLLIFASVYSTTVRTFTEPSVPGTWSENYEYGHTTPDISGAIDSMIWSGSGNTGDMDNTCSATIATNKHAFAISLKPAVTYSSVDIGAVEWNVDYTVPNNPPTISKVKDGPDPVAVGGTVTLSANWSDADSEGVKMLICKTDAITEAASPTCTVAEWCSNKGDYYLTNPLSCNYTVTSGDVGVQNYYAFVCDNEPDCNVSGTLGTFTVNSAVPMAIRFLGNMRFLFGGFIGTGSL